MFSPFSNSSFFGERVPFSPASPLYVQPPGDKFVNNAHDNEF